MANKCLLQTKGGSFCRETTVRLTKLFACKRNIDDQLQRWYLSQHIASVQEHEFILNIRSDEGLTLETSAF